MLGGAEGLSRGECTVFSLLQLSLKMMSSYVLVAGNACNIMILVKTYLTARLEDEREKDAVTISSSLMESSMVSSGQ